MQAMLGTEFGGMNAVLTDLYQQTGDARWLTAAQRFDHAAVFDPLAANQDQLNGLHANTQVPKWIGAAREYKATGTTRYRDIATNAWNISRQRAHLRHRRQQPGRALPGARTPSPAYLANDTCERCNTYNMLKLTRELWLLDPDRAAYFDFYERALLNHLIGQQNPADAHGHVTYFTPLNPGGRRGVGPAWGGGTWSTDYDSFWCCQGTGLETNTKLMDSIYFHNGTTLTVNLFMPSVLNWTQRGITVTQTTSYPVSDTTTLQVTGSVGGSWSMRIRIPAGPPAPPSASTASRRTSPPRPAPTPPSPGPGPPATPSPSGCPCGWSCQAANDNPNVAAVTYGPVVLSGNYGNTTLSRAAGADHVLGHPDQHHRARLHRHRQRRDGQPRPVLRRPRPQLHRLLERHGQAGTGDASFRLVNAASGLVLGIQNMSTADGGLAAAVGRHRHRRPRLGADRRRHRVRLRNVNSGKVLGVENMSTADNARVLQWADNGTADHRWTIVDVGDGYPQAPQREQRQAARHPRTAPPPRARRPSRTRTTAAPTTSGGSCPTAPGASRTSASGLVLGVQNMSTADGGLVIQWGDNGTADHLWTAVVDTGGYLRLRNSNSGKVLGVENARHRQRRPRSSSGPTTAPPTTGGGCGTARNGYFRIQCANGGRVLGVSGASTAQGAQVVLGDDNGTNDHLWRFI